MHLATPTTGPIRGSAFHRNNNSLFKDFFKGRKLHAESDVTSPVPSTLPTHTDGRRIGMCTTSHRETAYGLKCGPYMEPYVKFNIGPYV